MRGSHRDASLVLSLPLGFVEADALCAPFRVQHIVILVAAHVVCGAGHHFGEAVLQPPAEGGREKGELKQIAGGRRDGWKGGGGGAGGGYASLGTEGLCVREGGTIRPRTRTPYCPCYPYDPW